ncbi:MAG TPA: ShlB/FhaC/HecB family hemolysin secretion/activation protein [Alphaproteobacteria bacterium]|nr:ShlB/FhaC/HecB family hemolysin secretion/activation protein [Rhodospirillaceae bacterium]HRJ65565.1 ShlB/FhaC/HecB family hemolysin secretion/activation protein [Alphaproteobacteria bacterium]
MIRRLFAFTATAAFLSVIAPQFALAQAVPSSAEPSRAGGQIAPQQAPGLTEFKGSITAQGSAAQAPAGADKVTLTLKEIVIEGASVYDDAALSAVYQDKVGTKITLADVYDIAAQLTAKYRNEGYILTQVVIPPQTIDGGTVRMRVVEGFVDKVSVEGGMGVDTAFLQGYAKKINASKPLNSKTLERYILLINDLPGMSARAVLSPSPNVVGASDVTIFVERKAYDAFFQIDNRGSRFLGPLQVNAGGRLNNMFGLYEGLSFQFVTAPDGWPDRELDFGSVAWSQPINHEGTRVSVGYSITSTEPGYSLTPFDIEGLARSANIEVMHPFIRTRQQNLYGTLRFNYIDTERNDNLGLGKTEDRLRVLRLAGTYQFTDGFLGLNTVNAELSKGIDILNMKEKDSLNPTRERGEPEFFKATMEISRIQRVTNMIELFGSVQGQKSAHKLLASEEFGVGGINYGSAYNNSEITGEDGVAGRVELRLNNPVRVPVNFSQVYGFYDIGKVWDNDSTVVKDRQRSIASAGLGLRVNLNDNLAGTFEAAMPLTRTVETEGDKDLRLFGSLTARF